MTLFDAALLGIVEGTSEFLPISSTGHLILTGTLLGIPESAFVKTFEIAIQSGAILAVVALYFRSFLDTEILKRLVVAFIPTGIIGLALYSVVKTYLLGNELVVLSSLLLGGIVLIVFEYFHREAPDAVDIRSMSYTHAAFVGLCQAIAIVPGVSRSAATIVGGLLLGMRRVAIVEFSFLLAVPTMAAATGLAVLKNMHAFSNADIAALAVGFIISFIVALATIRWLLDYVRSHSFIPFGVYRIVIAMLFFLFIVH